MRIDPESGYKKFQGVWLEREDGERWVVAYRPEGWLTPFAGRRVRVTGERYEPEGQAIMGPLLRVHTLRLVDPKADAPALVAVGPERALVGVFSDPVGAPHTTSEGEVHRVFTALDGSSFMAPSP